MYLPEKFNHIFLAKDNFNCPICECTRFETLFFSKKEDYGDILRCSDCRFVTVFPIPSNEIITSSYLGLYKERENMEAVDQLKFSQVRPSVTYYFSKIDSSKKSNRIKFLDIGGGLGYYSASAKELGMTPYLIDLDSESLNFAKDVLGIQKVFQGTLETFCASTDEKFDLILLRHVIEHLPDPNHIIAKIKSLLSENGVAIIETPNNKSIEAFLNFGLGKDFIRKLSKNYSDVSFRTLIKKRVYAMRPPIHLNAFEISNFQVLMERNDLKISEYKTYRLGDPIFWPNFKSYNSDGLKNFFKSISFIILRSIFSRKEYSGIFLSVTHKE